MLALAFLLACVGVIFIVLGDPAAYWAQLMREPLAVLLENSQIAADEKTFNEVLSSVSQWMTALLTAGFFLQLVIAVFIGRWWQAVLYNPAGFGREFRQMQYHRLLALLAAPLFIWVMLSEPPDWVAAVATLLVAAYFLQGLSVAHALLKHFDANAAWVAGMYVLLFIALPYVMTALAMTGFTDTWMNFRKNVARAGDAD